MSVSTDLAKLKPLFEGSEWCQGCRDWYKSEQKECPDCKDDLQKENDQLKKALESIQLITLNNHDHDFVRINKICKEALK